MAALWRIVEVLGPAVLRLVSSPDGAHTEIGDVSLHDPAEPLVAADGDLILALGAAEDSAAVVELIAASAGAGAAAVAGKPPAALAVRGGSAATIDDVSAQRVLMVLSDLLDEHPELTSEKVRALVASDAEHGTVYVETLRAYLDAFGSIPKAADDLGVHPNTLRYRLRRALELADLDLEDGDERVVVELGLRLLPEQER